VIAGNIERVLRDAGCFGWCGDEIDGEQAAEAILAEIRREQVRAENAKDTVRSAAFKLVADWMEK